MVALATGLLLRPDAGNSIGDAADGPDGAPTAQSAAVAAHDSSGVPAADSTLSQPGPRPDSTRPAGAPSPGFKSPAVRLGLPEVLPLEEGVKDPVFALLVGLVSSATYGTLTHERLERELRSIGRPSRLPFETLVDLTRNPVRPGHTSLVTLHFEGGLDLPVPYSILGYHPGSFTATETCVFREWILGTVRLGYTAEVDGRHVGLVIELEDVHLYGLKEGGVKIDIDGWLDRMMGGSLDDTDVTALMLGKYKGRWYGFAMGYNKDHEGRSGAFDFAKDEILFPTPSELKPVGRQMRARSEQLATEWAAGVERGDALPSAGR